MMSRPAMLLGSLLLLVATMSTAQESGEQLDRPQRSQPPRPHMKVLSGSSMEQPKNKLKSSTPMLQKIMNQMSLMEHQIPETLLSTDKLEKQLQEQSHELYQQKNSNSDLETPLPILDTQQQAQLAGLHSLTEQLSSSLNSVRHNWQAPSDSSSQQQFLENLQRLIQQLEQGSGQVVLGFQDCDKIHRYGVNDDGIYTILVPKVKKPQRVFCVMNTDGGAWTLIQRRENGTVDFHRSWQEYKQGFGDPAGEYWLGNEVVHQITSKANYSLHVELEDWDGNTFSADYGNFQLGSEEQFYRIFLDKHSGVASLQRHLILKNSNFSTHDADHDSCPCNCAVTMSGGWWFDACGASNLNGIYYPAGQHLNKINGIRWHHSNGPTYSLRTTRMMIRPSIS